jgi:hypothetical protein
VCILLVFLTHTLVFLELQVSSTIIIIKPWAVCLHKGQNPERALKGEIHYLFLAVSFEWAVQANGIDGSILYFLYANTTLLQLR